MVVPPEKDMCIFIPKPPENPRKGIASQHPKQYLSWYYKHWYCSEVYCFCDRLFMC